MTIASCRGHHRFDDIFVAGATTQITLEFLACRCRIKAVGMPFQNIDRGHDHAGGTETALQAVFISEGLLYGVQGIGGEAFDCRDMAAILLQDFTATPSTWTTQAPHWLVSQPVWVPVSPRSSRSKSTSSWRSSISA